MTIEDVHQASADHPVLSDLIAHHISVGTCACLTSLEEFYKRAKALEDSVPTRDDLEALVRGTFPAYVTMGDPFVAAHGSYSGSRDEWTWDRRALSALDGDGLRALYKAIKQPA